MNAVIFHVINYKFILLFWQNYNLYLEFLSSLNSWSHIHVCVKPCACIWPSTLHYQAICRYNADWNVKHISYHVSLDINDSISSLWNRWHQSNGWQNRFNSPWPSDTIWWYRSGSTLAQVMACCLTAPSHYLNQSWLIIAWNLVTFTRRPFHRKCSRYL